jgi:chromate reductase
VLILGISGSLRRGSHNRTLLRAAAAELPPSAEFREWDGLATLPAYDEDCDQLSRAPSVDVLRRVLLGADAALIATPEYNHSIPGALKNALDWASRPFPENSLRGLPVAVIGTSTGLFGAVWAQAELRKVLGAAGADVIADAVAVPSAGSAFSPTGRLRDPHLAEQLRLLVRELMRRSSRRIAA